MTNTASMMAPTEPTEWTLPSPRKVAVVCLIATEAALFTIFVVAYLFYIGKSVSGPSPAHVLETPIWATICLLSSSFTIVLAQRALGQQRIGRFQLWWGLTIFLGAAFLWATAREWYRLIVQNNLTISTNLFGTTFYSLVGLHATRHDFGAEVILAAHGVAEHSPQEVDLSDMRECIGNRALEDLAGVKPQRLR